MGDLIKREGKVAPPEDGYQPLPADVLDEFYSADFGPCIPREHYYSIETNRLGEVQLHPCSCGSLFPYSPVYGWFGVNEGSPLAARIAELARSLLTGRT